MEGQGQVKMSSDINATQKMNAVSKSGNGLLEEK